MNTLRNIFVILLSLFIVSCSSSLPEPNADYQTILIIPVSAKNSSDHAFNYSLSFEISKRNENGDYIETAYSGRIHPKENITHVIVTDLQPGKYNLTRVIKYRSSSEKKENKLETRVFDQPFQLAKGEINILPKAIRMVQLESKTKKHSFNFALRTIPFYEKADLVKLLKKDKVFAKWKLSSR